MLLRIFPVLFLLPGLVNAQALDVNVSEDTARFSYRSPLLMRGLGDAQLAWGFSFNDTEDYVAHLGLGVEGDTGERFRFNLGAGARLLLGDIADQTVAVAGLGGHVRFYPDQAGRFGLGFEAFYAPKITSFMDADNYTETEARVEFRFLTTAAAYIGFRRVEFEFADGQGKAKFDKGSFVGLRMGF